MPSKNTLTPAEIKLLLIESGDAAHEKLKAELPEMLRPIMQETTESALNSFGRKLGIDFKSVDSVNKYHRERTFVEKKLAGEADFKRTMIASISKFSVAGFLGWCISKL